MAFILGLTGGIGSGKSVASNHFETLGVTVVDSDIIAREVVALNSPALQHISEYFGKDILLATGELDRAVVTPTHTRINQTTTVYRPSPL